MHSLAAVEVVDIDLGDPSDDQGIEWTLALPSVQEFKFLPPQHEVAYEYGRDYCGGRSYDAGKSGGSEITLRFFAPGLYLSKVVVDDRSAIKILRFHVGVTTLAVGGDCSPVVGISQTVSRHTQSVSGTGTFVMIAAEDTLDRAVNIYPSAARVSNLDDMLQAARAAYQANGNRPVRAILIAHGSPGLFRVGRSLYRIENGEISVVAGGFGRMRDYISALELVSCCFAYGVANSAGTIVNQHFMPRLAAHLGVPVSAYDSKLGIALRYSVGGVTIRESYIYAVVSPLYSATWYTV